MLSNILPHPVEIARIWPNRAESRIGPKAVDLGRNHDDLHGWCGLNQGWPMRVVAIERFPSCIMLGLVVARMQHTHRLQNQGCLVALVADSAIVLRNLRSQLHLVLAFWRVFGQVSGLHLKPRILIPHEPSSACCRIGSSLPLSSACIAGFPSSSRTSSSGVMCNGLMRGWGRCFDGSVIDRHLRGVRQGVPGKFDVESRCFLRMCWGSGSSFLAGYLDASRSSPSPSCVSMSSRCSCLSIGA